MWVYFRFFIKKIFGFEIPHSSANYGEFSKEADPDGSLQVDLDELSEFFEKFVDAENQVVNLKMGEGLKGSMKQQKIE
jgi:hypothetical protein